MSHNFTPHKAEFSYRTQYPNWADFGIPSGSSIYVNQGRGNISSDGKPLRSDGFGQCSALILKNTQTLESALFHLDNIDVEDKQTPIVEQLMHNYIKSFNLSKKKRERLLELASAASRYWCSGFRNERFYSGRERNFLKTRMAELNEDKKIKACFVNGNRSYDRKKRIVGDFLIYFGLNNPKNIFVDTGDYHWDIAYKPDESTILVNSRKQKKVLSFDF
ncbi:hypothetical protein J4474_01350 [Candidatus Pacearchaeota archaeon]|nr:hypothetical protein [Candidatus Pacearchaeota archaeon]